MTDPKAAKDAARKERLAAELRANLKKRKAQSRARLSTSANAEKSEPSEPHLRGYDPSAKA